MTVTLLRNPRDNSREVSILPEGNDTKAQVLARAAQLSGTVWTYEDTYLGKTTLNEVVIKWPKTALLTSTSVKF